MASKLIEKVLFSGLADWVTLYDVHRLAFDVGGAKDEEDARRLTIETIRRLLDDGLAQVGDVSDGGFFPWATSLEDSLRRIEKEWASLNREFFPGDVCWLANTPLGDQLASRFLQENE
jgi:hypothetical protein